MSIFILYSFWGSLHIHQGVIALKKVKEINENIELLTKEKQELPEQIISLQNLIEKNGVEDFIFTFMGKTHIARKKYFESIPIYGSIFFELIKTISMINKETNNKK